MGWFVGFAELDFCTAGARTGPLRRSRRRRAAVLVSPERGPVRTRRDGDGRARGRTTRRPPPPPPARQHTIQSYSGSAPDLFWLLPILSSPSTTALS